VRAALPLALHPGCLSVFVRAARGSGALGALADAGAVQRVRKEVACANACEMNAAHARQPVCHQRHGYQRPRPSSHVHQHTLLSLAATPLRQLHSYYTSAHPPLHNNLTLQARAAFPTRLQPKRSPTLPRSATLNVQSPRWHKAIIAICRRLPGALPLVCRSHAEAQGLVQHVHSVTKAH
jgi:hypothetical protein